MRTGKSKFFFLSFLCLNLLSEPLAGADVIEGELQQICPKVALRGHKHISLGDTERNLVCGDPKSEAWRDIPHSQALFHLKAFLQDRGYFLSRIESDNPFIIDLGPPTLVLSVTLKEKGKALPSQNLRDVVRIDKMRKLTGDLLTPGFLDHISDRILSRIHSKGYPCASVDMSANALLGDVSASVTLGPKQNITDIKADVVQGISPETLRRYDAFHLQEVFDEDSLTITANRTVNSGIVQTAHLSGSCGLAGATVRETTVAGPPRLITIGFGLDTERIAQVRASWKHLRLGTQGSSVEFTALAALRQQELNANSQWYYLQGFPRHFLNSQISIRHENEIPYENLKADLQALPSLTWDTRTLGFSTSLGPSLSWEHTYRPWQSRRDTFFAAARAEFRVTSHAYELHQTAPQDGFDVSLHGIFTQQDFLSDVSAQRIGINFSNLFNLFNFEPALLVLGLRGGLATTFLGKTTTISALPPSLKHYLGGSENLRGFDRRELAGPTGLGALTSAYLSLEVRVPDFVPWGIQPIGFADAGLLGTESISLKGPLYFSPGLGARWQSPIGVFRGTFSHGFLYGERNGIAESTAHWKFYISFGEEF